MLNGLLVIDKPPGPTSFHVVSKVKTLLKVKKVGHGGALDPMASGVLVVCLGRATKLASQILNSDKEYLATMELGKATDTYDAEGKIVLQGQVPVDLRDRVEEALEEFKGVIRQVPPAYSAVKISGRPAYKWARDGVKVKLPERQVCVYTLELLAVNSPLVELRIVCSKGTYIRSLVHDIGMAIGCGAYVKKLVRTRCGSFTLKDALPYRMLEAEDFYSQVNTHLLPVSITACTI